MNKELRDFQNLGVLNLVEPPTRVELVTYALRERRSAD